MRVVDCAALRQMQMEEIILVLWKTLIGSNDYYDVFFIILTR